MWTGDNPRLRLLVRAPTPGGCGATPPARLRGTMENGSTGQTRSSNPPPACGAGCARVRRSRFGVRPHGKAHSARPVGSRMRFSVTTRPQNAPFRRMRLSSPGQTWRHLTEKHTLPPAPHGKAHSGLIDSRKSAFCDPQVAQTAHFRHVAAPGRCGATPPPGCGALWKMAQLGKCARATTRQPAGRVARVSADLGSESNLTEGRTLPDRRAPECAFPSRRDRRLRFSVECAFPHLGKRGASSRKSALCHLRLTEKRTLA